MSGTIAGHTFSDALGGRRCIGCGKRWSEIAGATEEAVGEFGWAHSGTLIEREFEEIRAERDRIWDAVKEAASA